MNKENFEKIVKESQYYGSHPECGEGDQDIILYVSKDMPNFETTIEKIKAIKLEHGHSHADNFDILNDIIKTNKEYIFDGDFEPFEFDEEKKAFFPKIPF